MPRLLTVAALALLLGAPIVAMQSQASTTTAFTGPMRFGIDADGVAGMTALGAKSDYATLWVGPWTLAAGGWSGPDGQLAALRTAGVTPAVHLYYWGDDITPSCIENGCWSSLHNAQLDKAHWQTLTQQLADHLNAKLAGRPALVFLETEFNKGSAATYEPLDGYLADKARFLHGAYPAAKVVLPFGNWNSGAWTTFDRAAAASDYTGVQGMRGSTHDSATSATGLFSATLAGAKTLQSDFGKPVILQDIAVSSYPEPAWLTTQADALRGFTTGMSQLKAAGVQAILYRALADQPGMDTANYYGQAERHWGLGWSATSLKPAGKLWVAAVQAERGGSLAQPPTATGTFTATFTPRSVGNDWWVETGVATSGALAKVEVRVDGGAWSPLPRDAWGTYAASLHAPNGSGVMFRATDTAGHTATSGTYTWP